MHRGVLLGTLIGVLVLAAALQGYALHGLPFYYHATPLYYHAGNEHIMAEIYPVPISDEGLREYVLLNCQIEAMFKKRRMYAA